mgnify:CR=1 FL=1|tara:strand:+ start:3747 stop:3935 length:189 start_codon:yes stop_codon:yes gene_type:complete
MSKDEIQKLVEIRTTLISEFNKLNEYQRDRNAIMKQVDHAALIHSTIKKIDDVLSAHVSFSE